MEILRLGLKCSFPPEGSLNTIIYQKNFIDKVFSLPATDNYFLEKPEGIESFCEIASDASNISNIVVSVPYLESLSKELKESLFLYFDLFAEYCSIYLISDGD
ncbi:hypothetical protein SNQ76_003668, partial [Cronobacter sakazakii]|nr:hypothetical protein [Cronobacter sakazakii]